MARVRSRDSALGRLLAVAPGAIYALNERRELVYCNDTCGELLGVDPQLLIGHRSDYHTADGPVSPASIVASLAPPPEIYTGISGAVELSLLHASGHLVSRRVVFQPLGVDALHCVGVLAFVGDASQRLGTESESAQLHRHLWELRRTMAASCEVDELIGVSPMIQRVRDQIQLASHGRLRVVIYGPSGSGREHVARLLHRRMAPKAYGQLVPLCCPLLDAELLQATIMSLVREPLTESGQGAGSQGVSASEIPTLLLLEVDKLSEEAQSELAGFLTLPQFELYAIATSGESLTALAEQGRFQSNLAYALSTLTIELPPLDRRVEDIPLLCQYFLEKCNAQGGRQLSGFTSEALDALAGYPWPENVDELSEVVELACQRAEGPWVEEGDLPSQIEWSASAAAHPPKVDEPIDLDAFLAEIERELIVRALRRSKGNKTRAALLLGMNRARFHRRLEFFGMT